METNAPPATTTLVTVDDIMNTIPDTFYLPPSEGEVGSVLIQTTLGADGEVRFWTEDMGCPEGMKLKIPRGSPSMDLVLGLPSLAVSRDMLEDALRTALTMFAGQMSNYSAIGIRPGADYWGFDINFIEFVPV